MLKVVIYLNELETFVWCDDRVQVGHCLVVLVG